MPRQVNRTIPTRAAIGLAVLVAACAAPNPSASPSPAPSTIPLATASAAPSSPAPSVNPGPDTRIALSGSGPIGLDVADGRAWVGLVDSGHVSEVDLAAGREVNSIAVGFGVSHVVIGDDAVYGSRIDDAGGNSLVIVDPASGDVTGIQLGPLESVSVDGAVVWVLQRDGTVRIIDAATGAVRASASVHLDADAHSEAVPGGGALWVSGDRTPVHRIDATTAEVGPDIETGGGIPLAFDRGLVWGARPDEAWAIDAAAGTVSRHVPLDGLAEILAMDVNGDDAWIAARKPGRIGVVVRIDLATGSVAGEFGVSLPAGVVIDADRVWVTSYDTNKLLGYRR